MTKALLSRLALALAVIGLVALMAPSAQAQAQVNPRDVSVTEDSLFQALGASGTVAGRVTIPNQAAGTLIAADNKTWAAFQRQTLNMVSIGAVVGMLALLVLFYALRGKIRIDSGFSGRKILRFVAIERFAHWTMASTFIILALSGLNLVVGRIVILPLVGEGAFGTLTAWGKVAHNYLAWPFMASLLLVFVLWVIHNLPSRVDWQWIKMGGGVLKKGVHPPARKFNAGQKLVFWSVILGGAALSYTGVMMLLPGMVASAAEWQFYQTIHALVAAGLSALVIAHIYIGSVGMEGAFDAMGSGEVDENWAKEHHSLWVAEVKSAAKASGARPVATPAE